MALKTVYAVKLRDFNSADQPIVSKGFLTQAEANNWVEAASTELDSHPIPSYIAFQIIPLTVSDKWIKNMNFGENSSIKWPW